MSTLQDARTRDAADPLRRFRDEFIFPQHEGQDAIYLCGNSLGLQPRATARLIAEELDDWARLGVEAHFHGRRPWYGYHEQFAEPVAHIVGALPHEVVVMGSLTANLHTLMVSFYRPTVERYKIVIEANAFPSDRYAVASQAQWHGFDPADAIVEFAPRAGAELIETEDVEAWLREHGHEVALLLFSGVNYYSGQAYNIPRITAAGHAAGALVGWDLAHAAGNLELRLHESGCDFAAWCTYKYLNSGPGGVGGAFVHERWANAPQLPRFAGWWGNDPGTRFEMPHEFVPQRGAPGWQVSNAPVLAMAAHLASVRLFAEATMPALRAKSIAMTDYLLGLIDTIPTGRFTVITPRDPAARGGQLSIQASRDPRELFEELQRAGVICDFRKPDVIRIAAAPLYNSYEDLWRFADVLAASSSA